MGIIGTRGAYGFYRGGEDKISYNHFDSYPDGLGEDVVRFCRETSVQEMNEIFDRVVLVSEDMPPTSEQIDECIDFFSSMVSTGQPNEWYALLREAQGDLQVLKHGLDYMIDNASFLKNSLFCEWGYVINLDRKTLEVYRGFQSEPSENRYVVKEPYSGYFNCKLVAEFPLGNIPEDWKQTVENER